jgi:hypothetical protein
MICAFCDKEVGFHRCGNICFDCMGGPVVDPRHRGFRPFMQAIGSNIKISEAYRADIRSRRIDRSHGVMDASTGRPVNHVYRHAGERTFFT